MKMMRKIEKAIVFTLRNIISPISPRLCSQFMLRYFKRKGMKILGRPNYISAKIWFDGTDYSLIELNEGCAISSNVRVLTHDWSPYTTAMCLGLNMEKKVGVFRPVRVGRHAFVGTYSVLMPGADVGDGAIVGAGSIVRGKVEPWTIVAGSPAKPVGDSREYLLRQLKRQGNTKLLNEAICLLEESGYEIPEEYRTIKL